MSGQEQNLLSIDPDRSSLAAMERDPKRPRLGSFIRFVVLAIDGLAPAKFCFHILMAFCKTFRSLSAHSVLVDHETVGLTLELPEGVDASKFAPFYQQLQNQTELVIDSNNLIWSLPWHHYMGFDRGLLLCKKALKQLIEDGWVKIAVHTSPAHVEDELDEYLPYLYLACKYKSVCPDSAAIVYNIIVGWQDDELILRTVLSNMTLDHWKLLFHAAAWDEDVCRVLLVLLNSVIPTMVVEARHLSDSLMPHLTIAAVNVALASL